MRKWKRFVVISLVILLAVFAVAVVAALALEPAAPSAAQVGWQVIANGGTTMSSPSFTMLSTAGQPATGTSTSSGYQLLSGYWNGFQQFVWDVLLPIIVDGAG